MTTKQNLGRIQPFIHEAKRRCQRLRVGSVVVNVPSGSMITQVDSAYFLGDLHDEIQNFRITCQKDGNSPAPRQSDSGVFQNAEVLGFWLERLKPAIRTKQFSFEVSFESENSRCQCLGHEILLLENLVTLTTEVTEHLRVKMENLDLREERFGPAFQALFQERGDIIEELHCEALTSSQVGLRFLKGLKHLTGLRQLDLGFHNSDCSFWDDNTFRCLVGALTQSESSQTLNHLSLHSRSNGMTNASLPLLRRLGSELVALRTFEIAASEGLSLSAIQSAFLDKTQLLDLSITDQVADNGNLLASAQMELECVLDKLARFDTSHWPGCYHALGDVSPSLVRELLHKTFVATGIGETGPCDEESDESSVSETSSDSSSSEDTIQYKVFTTSTIAEIDDRLPDGIEMNQAMVDHLVQAAAQLHAERMAKSHEEGGETKRKSTGNNEEQGELKQARINKETEPGNGS